MGVQINRGMFDDSEVLQEGNRKRLNSLFSLSFVFESQI